MDEYGRTVNFVGENVQTNVNVVTSANATTTTVDEQNPLQVIINNQEKLAKRILCVEKGLQDINSQLFNLSSFIKNTNSNSRPHSSMSVMSSTSNLTDTSDAPAQNIVHNLIDDEEMMEFERSIEDECHDQK